LAAAAVPVATGVTAPAAKAMSGFRNKASSYIGKRMRKTFIRTPAHAQARLPRARQRWRGRWP
jgi:hypothetical protein